MKPLSERPDWTIDQGWSSYTAAEHATWKTLFERQTQLLPGRACDEFVQGMRDLPMGADEIPNFDQIGLPADHTTPINIHVQNNKDGAARYELSELRKSAAFANAEALRLKKAAEGTINVDGVDKEISLWVKESAKGVKYFSAVIKEPFVKDVTNVKKIVENNSDDLPF